MLLASFFVLNRYVVTLILATTNFFVSLTRTPKIIQCSTEQINQHTIYPYVHSFSNIRDKAALLRAITLPDVNPSSLPPNANFSLVAGDFEEIYGTEEHEDDEPQAGEWNAIMTCFFIDTVSH